MQFLDLPPELIYIVIKKLDPVDHYFLNLTCCYLDTGKTMVPETSFTSNLSRFKFGIKHGFIRPSVSLPFHAIYNDNLECLKYTFEIGCVKSPQLLVYCAKLNRQRICDYLLTIDELSSRFSNHESSAVFMQKIFDAAAYNDNLEFLEYLTAKGIDICVETINAAAKGNSLRCVQYVESLIPDCYETYFDELMCIGDYAASSGNIEMIRHFHDKGHQFDFDDSYGAIEGDHVECFRYVVSLCNEERINFRSHSLFFRVLNNDSVKIFRYIDQISGIDYNLKMLNDIISDDRVKIFQYIYDENKYDLGTVISPYNESNSKIFRFLNKHNSPLICDLNDLLDRMPV
jgi:hypothetical protein